MSWLIFGVLKYGRLAESFSFFSLQPVIEQMTDK